MAAAPRASAEVDPRDLGSSSERSRPGWNRSPDPRGGRPDPSPGQDTGDKPGVFLPLLASPASRLSTGFRPPEGGFSGASTPGQRERWPSGRDSTPTSCSARVVSHHLGGLLRTRAAGLLRPAAGPEVHRVSGGRSGTLPKETPARTCLPRDTVDTLRRVPLVSSRAASPRPLPSCRHRCCAATHPAEAERVSNPGHPRSSSRCVCHVEALVHPKVNLHVDGFVGSRGAGKPGSLRGPATITRAGVAAVRDPLPDRSGRDARSGAAGFKALLH